MTSCNLPYFAKEHEEMRAKVREFAREVVAPVARKHDADATFPWATVKQMADLGLLGIPWPKRLGGSGGDFMSFIIAIHEMAKVDASHSITISAHTTLGTSPIMNFGTDAQRERFVPPLASGRVLGGFGLTEESAGSDAGGTRTTAVRRGDVYVLNGSKRFITHAGIGEVFVVTAVTNPSAGSKGISSFILTKENTRSRCGGSLRHWPRSVAGAHARIPRREEGGQARLARLGHSRAALPGRRGAGGESARRRRRGLHELHAHARLGAHRHRGALAWASPRAPSSMRVRSRARVASSARRSARFQGVQFQLSDMATEIAAGEHLVYHAAWLSQHKQPFAKEAAMAKLFCSELAMRATTAAVQIHGARGYTTEYPVERMMRDAKICEIGEGTSEIQRIVIARHLLAGVAD